MKTRLHDPRSLGFSSAWRHTRMTLTFQADPQSRMETRPLRPSPFDSDPPVASNLLVNETVRPSRALTEYLRYFPKRSREVYGHTQRCGFVRVRAAKAQSPNAFFGQGPTNRDRWTVRCIFLPRAHQRPYRSPVTKRQSEDGKETEAKLYEGQGETMGFFCHVRLSRHYLPSVAEVQV